MCPQDVAEVQQPLGPQLFEEVCGATPSGSTGQLQATGYANFGEWTPTETWAGAYTSLLQEQGANPAQQAGGAAPGASTSHSSQASGPEGAWSVRTHEKAGSMHAWHVAWKPHTVRLRR